MTPGDTVTFGFPGVDRAAHLRSELAEPSPEDARILFWRGKPLVRLGSSTELVRVDGAHTILAEHGAGPVFLGLEGGAPVYAHDISGWDAPDIDAVAMEKFFDNTRNRHPSCADDEWFVELRGVMAELAPSDANLAATARALFSWHRSHRYCAKCGGASESSDGGWRRDCPQCNSQHFPRTDPVVIVLVTHHDKVLLGRSPHWPPHMYSLLAGFVEPGESIEEASKREVLEESGIELGPVRYVASQPWPYPTSLMFGTAAEARTTEITLDPNELDDAIWVTREDILAAANGRIETLRPARKGSIAHFILQKWIRDEI